MSNDQPSRRAAAKSGGAPMGSTVSIIIAVVAVVVGFLVLRNITDNDDGGSSSDNTSANSSATDDTGDIAGTDGTTETTTGVTGPPTTPPIAPDVSQQVIVANASGLGGAAGQYTQALTGLGFSMGTATDATTPKQDLSVVYFLPGGEANATSVAQAMGSLDSSGVVTAAMPTPVPITGAVMPAGATVLVMLGTDRAGKALPILSGTTETTTLPAAPIDATTSTTTA